MSELKKSGQENPEAEHHILTGMFRDKLSTENAYNGIQDKGYTNEDINLVMSDKTRNEYFSEENKTTEIGTKAAEGAGKGSAIGSTVGAAVGVVAAIGTSVALPGIGIVLAGPIAAGLAGAGAGAITGGVIGALVGSGIPEARAKLYEKGIESGQIVIGVKPKNAADAEYFKDHWKRNDAVEVHH